MHIIFIGIVIVMIFVIAIFGGLAMLVVGIYRALTGSGRRTTAPARPRTLPPMHGSWPPAPPRLVGGRRVSVPLPADHSPCRNPYCQEINPDTARFCRRCGLAVQKDAPRVARMG